jgi:hypothetical protein
VPWPFRLFEQVGDVVQRQSGPQVAEVSGHDLEGLTWPGARPCQEATAQDLVDSLLEGPAGPAGLRFELGRDVFVDGERGSHILMMRERHHDVKRPHGPGGYSPAWARASRTSSTQSAGAEIVDAAAEAWKRADILVKVKEPLESEYPLMREGQILFTYLHLAPLPALTQALLDRKVTGVAYETITRADGSLPLLTPMSEVAGRMAIQVGARYLERVHGGRGVLLGGVPGFPRPR